MDMTPRSVRSRGRGRGVLAAVMVAAMVATVIGSDAAEEAAQAAGTAPTITGLKDQTTIMSVPVVGPLLFTVGDDVTPAGDLIVMARTRRRPRRAPRGSGCSPKAPKASSRRSFCSSIRRRRRIPRT